MICDICGKPFHAEAHKLGREMLCADCFQGIRQYRRKLRLILMVGMLTAVALVLFVSWMQYKGYSIAPLPPWFPRKH
jgi:predicted secreted protein